MADGTTVVTAASSVTMEPQSINQLLTQLQEEEQQPLGGTEGSMDTQDPSDKAEEARRSTLQGVEEATMEVGVATMAGAVEGRATSPMVAVLCRVSIQVMVQRLSVT